MTSEDPETQAAQSDREQMTADEYRQVAKVLAREGKWEDLAALLIERAEASTTTANQVFASAGHRNESVRSA